MPTLFRKDQLGLAMQEVFGKHFMAMLGAVKENAEEKDIKKLAETMSPFLEDMGEEFCSRILSELEKYEVDLTPILATLNKNKIKGWCDGEGI